MATLKKNLEKQFDIDVEFTKLMNSKEQYNPIMDFILRKHLDKFKYGGAFVFGYENSNLIDLIDKNGPSHDIVWEGFRQNVKGNKLKQGLYKTIEDYFNVNKPDNKKETIYFVGDANGNGEYVDVHWNCFIVCKGRILWYDPTYSKEIEEEDSEYGTKALLTNLDDYNSEEDEDYVYSEESEDELEYNSDSDFEEEQEKSEIDLNNFDSDKQKQIIDYFEKELILVEPEEPAQYYTEQGPLYTDIFCQSWVLLFASAYVEKEMENYLTNLDFFKYQTVILKQWLLNIFQQLDYEEIDYKNALTKARIKEVGAKLQLIKPISKSDTPVLELFRLYSKKTNVVGI